jgi:ABC-2 type transport system ATP-binding protein
MIEVEHVSKHFGAVRAVDDVSFKIEEGEIVGFLGPNGAGKSTLLKMMSTWLPLTAGHIRVAGHDVATEPLAVRRLLGYLPEHNALYEGMRVLRFLEFVADVRSIHGPMRRERLDWVVARCSLAPVLHKWVAECSKGFRQRIGLAAALLHDPPVLLLDEPTHGLDPLQVVQFRQFITELRKGRSILFSSHILAEVLSISERVLVIHHGKLLENAKVETLEKRAGSSKRSIEDVILDVVREKGSAA